MNDVKEYTEHNLGIYALMAYLARIPKDEFQIHDNIFIELSNSLSSRFAFAKAKTNIYGKYPLFLVQNEEFLWFNQIKWQEIILKKNTRKIYFIAKKVYVKDEQLPITPKFTIVLNLNNYSYIEYISKFKKISVKNIWFDEDKNMHIPKGNKNTEIKIDFINDEYYNLFSKEEINSFNSQNNILLSELNDLFKELEKKDIKYKGDKAKIDPEFLKEAEKSGVYF